MGRVQAGGWGPLCRNMEAGGMWKQRQVVGVGKWQGWGAWGKAQEGKGGPCVSLWTGASSLGDWQQIGGAWQE